MGTMSKSSVNKLYIKGMVAKADKSYREIPETWKSLVSVGSGEGSYHEETYYSGLGLMKPKPEGLPTKEDEFYQGGTQRWTFQPWGLMLRITREARDDDDKGLINDVKKFGESVKYTRHMVASRLFMNASNTNYHKGADKKALCAPDHDLIGGGVYSNIAAAAAYPSEAALEAAILAYEGIKNHRGMEVDRQVRKIVCGKQLRYEFNRILKSEGRPGTNHNDPNAVKNLHSLKLEVDPLISDKRWFVSGKKDPDTHPRWLDRVKSEMRTFGDFSTGDLLFKVYARWGYEFGQGHGYYMIPGV